MAFNLKNRHFVTPRDFSPTEISFLLKLAVDLKAAKYAGTKHTARVLGRVYDAIEYRGFGQTIVQELADHSGVPVYNGLTNEYHPTQILADFLNMREHVDKPLHDSPTPLSVTLGTTWATAC